jgi:uncharacterized membrane protein
MTENWITILVLAAGTFSIRLAGAVLGQAIPTRGAAARALNALPGCLIVALVASSLLSGGWREWSAGAVALAVAIVSRNLPLTMAAGIAAIYAARHLA